MAKFFVGQRVRLVGVKRPENLGAEGTVTHLGEWAIGHVLPEGSIAGEPMNVMVMFDRPINCGSEFDRHCGCLIDQLEPILPSGAAPSEYSLAELLVQLENGRVEA